MTPIVDTTIPTAMVAMMPLPAGASGPNLQPPARTGMTAKSTPAAAVPRPRATTQEATLEKAKEA